MLLRLFFLLLLTTARPSSVLAIGDVPRVLFGGHVAYAEAWDDERLWIVSGGRLLALDLCDEAPRPVRLAEGAARSGRGRARDVDKELILAGLDEGSWDDRVLEDFREDEGFSEEPRRPRPEGFGNESGVGPVRVLERRGDALAVVREREEWLCRPADAACKAQAHPARAARRPDPPPLRDDVLTERASAHGRWLTSAEGVWFSPREGLDLPSVCRELGRPSEPLPVTAFAQAPPLRAWTWLPEVTLLGARRAVTWGDGRRRADLLLMILLSFPAGADAFSPRDDISGIGR